jgi:hypothetical protein
MKYRVGWMMFAAVTLALSPMATSLHGTAYAQEASEEMMNEAQLSELLVNVLGLATLLPPNPQHADRFAILMQNGIAPKDGWSADNLVTIGNLARILVQSMGDADKVENPESDRSWVDYLASIGIEFGTIEDAVDQIDPLGDPLHDLATWVSTDPLRKVRFIRATDDATLGADLQGNNRPLLFTEIPLKPVDVIPVVRAPSRPSPSRPRPVTP